MAVAGVPELGPDSPATCEGTEVVEVEGECAAVQPNVRELAPLRPLAHPALRAAEPCRRLADVEQAPGLELGGSGARMGAGEPSRYAICELVHETAEELFELGAQAARPSFRMRGARALARARGSEAIATVPAAARIEPRAGV